MPRRSLSFGLEYTMESLLGCLDCWHLPLTPMSQNKVLDRKEAA